MSRLSPTRCNPVALGLKPRESVSNLGPTGQTSYFNRIEHKVRGSAVRALDLGPTRGKCQCAPQGVPSNTYEIWPGGPEFDTDSRGLSPKATGLHLVGVRGDILTSKLALPASWAEVGGSNGGPSNFAFYTIKIQNLDRGSRV